MYWKIPTAESGSRRAALAKQGDHVALMKIREALQSEEADDVRIAAWLLGRIGKPEEIAALIRFLASEESSYMTGQTVVASGGRVMLPG